MVKILSRRSLLIILAVIAFVFFGLLLLRRSTDVSARRTGGNPPPCVKEGSQGESPLVCCTGLTQLGDEKNFTCTRCGNGKCGPGETQLNCAQDCISCLKEGQSGEAPLSCCRGLTQLGGQFGFVCAKCGNGQCGTGEDENNCPQDCRSCLKAGMNGSYVSGQTCCRGLTVSDLGTGTFTCTECVQAGQAGRFPKACCPNLRMTTKGNGFTCAVPSPCGDGVCQDDENTVNCMPDCNPNLPPEPRCGDGECSPSERNTCARDCRPR